MEWLRPRSLLLRAVGRQDRQLNTYDWLADVPGNAESTDLVEVQFKNTRKGYYHNVNNLDLKKGDVVAVEANPGHDIGVVTLTGRLVKLQIKKANLKSQDDIKRIYRIAKQVDLDKCKEAKSREHGTMIQSRQIAKDLGLKMKIGDVEYQGDGNKAIFYYIADERVDFRQLIKVLADTFHVRIEMKQIGARQEAGTHRWNRSLRQRTLLRYLDEELRERKHQCRTLPGHLAQPSETWQVCVPN